VGGKLNVSAILAYTETNVSVGGEAHMHHYGYSSESARFWCPPNTTQYPELQVCANTSLYTTSWSYWQFNGSLNATGNVVIGKASQLQIEDNITVAGKLSVLSGGSLKIDNVGKHKYHRVQNLFVDSHGRVEALSSQIRVAKTLELAPHFYARCMNEKDFLAAGTGRNYTEMECPWGDYGIWGSRQQFSGPNASCLIRRDLCSDAAAAAPECNASWLRDIASASSCFVGADGDSVFDPSFNASQTCPAFPGAPHKPKYPHFPPPPPPPWATPPPSPGASEHKNPYPFPVAAVVVPILLFFLGGVGYFLYRRHTRKRDATGISQTRQQRLLSSQQEANEWAVPTVSDSALDTTHTINSPSVTNPYA
jgi:hypothetical protein